MLLSSVKNVFSCTSSCLVSIASKCCESCDSLLDPKRLSIGAIASSIITPLGMMIVSLAQKGGLIDSSRFYDILEKADAVRKSTGWNINLDAIMNATCKEQELVNQINSNFPDTSDHISLLANKVFASSYSIFAMPMLEELFYREFLQGFIFKKAFNFVIKNCVSQVKSPMIDKIDKVGRVVLTAGLFSLAHLINKNVLSDAQLQAQLIHTFVVGIGWGLLKESNVGLAGAAGAHMANNLIAGMDYLMSC